jgi:acyl carrier protein
VSQHRDLEAELKKLIVEVLALEHVTAEEIETDAPLFVEGLGLDSLDALEISMELEERYGVHFDEDPDKNQAIFENIGTIAAFVAANRTH